MRKETTLDGQVLAALEGGGALPRYPSEIYRWFNGTDRREVDDSLAWLVANGKIESDNGRRYWRLGGGREPPVSDFWVGLLKKLPMAMRANSAITHRAAYEAMERENLARRSGSRWVRTSLGDWHVERAVTP